MEKNIQNYRNLLTLSEYYLTSVTENNHIEELLYLEKILDRSRVYVRIETDTLTEEENILYQSFKKEINTHLDTKIRPQLEEKIKKLSQEEKDTLLQSITFTHINMLEQIKAIHSS